MHTKYKVIFITLYVLEIAAILAALLHGNTIAILSPKGSIASQERSLIILATVLMLVVVIPVFALTFWIAWKYRASNTKATYTPEWDHNRTIELVWWGIPFVLIGILSVVTWVASHKLDPFRPIASTKEPLTIQVVALDWKWLFIYPEQDIATVNFVQFPVDRPVNFEITSDAPMNSFWIPQLGGQIYAMSGMSTELHLMADKTGDYNGSSANISGKGFAGMTFIARASTDTAFAQWVQSAKQSPNTLSQSTYDELAKPSENNPVAYYSSEEPGLYNAILSKYTSPSGAHKMGM